MEELEKYRECLDKLSGVPFVIQQAPRHKDGTAAVSLPEKISNM